MQMIESNCFLCVLMWISTNTLNKFMEIIFYFCLLSETVVLFIIISKNVMNMLTINLSMPKPGAFTYTF